MLLLAVPFAGLAVTEQDVFPLVTCGGTGTTAKGLQWVPRPCNICDLFSLAKRALDAIWWVLAVPIATIMFIYAGTLLLIASMGGGSGAAERGKKILWNVIIGILIAFFGWLIVDTAIKFLAAQSIGEPKPAELFEGQITETRPVEDGLGEETVRIGYGPWNEIRCVAPPLPPEPQPAAPPPAAPAAPPTAPQPLPPSETTYSESLARSTLGEAGIPVYKSCVSKSTRYQDLKGGQTCVDGIRKSVVDSVVAFKKESGCTDVGVTGGTEAGHAQGTNSHGNGYKIDINRTTCVTNHIEKKYQDKGIRSDGARIYVSPTGAEWAKEHDHWDVKGWEGTP